MSQRDPSDASPARHAASPPRHSAETSPKCSVHVPGEQEVWLREGVGGGRPRQVVAEAQRGTGSSSAWSGRKAGARPAGQCPVPTSWPALDSTWPGPVGRRVGLRAGAMHHPEPYPLTSSLRLPGFGIAIHPSGSAMVATSTGMGSHSPRAAARATSAATSAARLLSSASHCSRTSGVGCNQLTVSRSSSCTSWRRGSRPFARL